MHRAPIMYCKIGLSLWGGRGGRPPQVLGGPWGGRNCQPAPPDKRTLATPLGALANLTSTFFFVFSKKNSLNFQFFPNFFFRKWKRKKKRKKNLSRNSLFKAKFFFYLKSHRCFNLDAKIRPFLGKTF